LQLLASIEPIAFWGGLVIYLVALAMYAGRTRDFKSILMFWQPTIAFSALEFKVSRAGLALMIAGLLMRVAVLFL